LDLVVPDIGNAHDVDVVDVLIKPGDVVEVDTPLVTLETDKASMDVPSTSAGTVAEVLLKRGDKVSAGSVIARVETNSQAPAKGVASTDKGQGPVDASQGAAGGQSQGAADKSQASAGPGADATFAASFDADELERTVTQPVLKLGALPPGIAGNGAGGTAGARPSTAGAPSATTTPAAAPNAPNSATAAPPPLAARPETAGDTVRMPIPDLTRGGRDADFNRSI